MSSLLGRIACQRKNLKNGIIVPAVRGRTAFPMFSSSMLPLSFLFSLKTFTLEVSSDEEVYLSFMEMT
jgi:hypothetical protein